MLVPAVFAASTSASPANVPPVIATVALDRLRSSGSVTDAPDDKVAADPSSVHDAVVSPDSDGGSLTKMTLTLEVCGALVSRPSFTNQVSVREVSVRLKSVGFSPP